MGVKYGVLGILRSGKAHGYELKARFDKLMGEAWPVKAPQLYSTLERLEAGGLVSRERVEQARRPDRNVFSITTAGDREFRRWLTAPNKSPRTLRDEFFIKATFALEESPAVAAELFDNQRRTLVKLLQQLQRVRRQAEESSDWRLVLLTKGALRHADADLRWLDDFTAVLAERGGR